MSLTIKQLENRLAEVEKELAELRRLVAGKSAEPWFVQILGAYADERVSKEVARLGSLIRRGKLKN
jgi:hypothetical protein